MRCHLHRSFKKILSKNGPKIDPCGTPKKISSFEVKAGETVKDNLKGVQDFSYCLNMDTVLPG